MRSTSTVFFALFLLVCLCLPRATNATPIYQGMSLPGWGSNAFSGSSFPQTVTNLDQIGVDTVSVVYTVFQDNLQSSGNIHPVYNLYSVSPASIRRGIDEIQSQGMSIMLKPHLDIIAGSWRAELNPDDPVAWFASYQRQIISAARLAEEKGIAILCIGTELNGVEKYEAEWRQLIHAVRQVYSGRLTYAANHSPAGVGGGYQSVRWWDALDLIGIDAYFPASNNRDSLRDFENFWQSKGREVEIWRNRRRLNQPVIFTEVGVRSMDGAARTPWDYEIKGSVDLDEQAHFYEGLLTSLWNEPWWGGAFWWSWETNPDAGGPINAGFTPQQKPAEEILEKFYTAAALHPGDANQDLRFDQIDIIQIAQAGKYLAGLRATWGEGDWDGAPGGIPGLPPPGNGFFDQVDLVSALQGDLYLASPNAADAKSIPEPDSKILLVAGISLLFVRRRC